MKAPDKIYIQQDMINNLILEKQEFDDDVEYIRKDALLKWLTYEVEEVNFFNDGDGYEDTYQRGIREGISRIINELNSM